MSLNKFPKVSSTEIILNSAPRKSIAPNKQSAISSITNTNNFPSRKSMAMNNLNLFKLPEQENNNILNNKHLRNKSTNNLDTYGSLPSNDNNSNTDRSHKNIQISKSELTNMLKEMKEEILEETNQKKNEFVNKVAEKHKVNNDKLAFTKDEIREMLKEYKEKIKKDIINDAKKQKSVNSPDYQAQFSLMQQQQYAQFQSLLWYYYIYNPELYRQLIDEYNHRLHNQLLTSLGLSEDFSNKNFNDNNNNNMGNGVKFNVSTNEDVISPQNSKNKSNIRKSLFIGQNPDLLASTITPASRKSIYQPDNTRKSIYIGNENNENNRKSIYFPNNNKVNENSRKSISVKPGDNYRNTLINAGKLSIGETNNLKTREDMKEDLKRVRKKSVMPSKEQRELLKKQDDEDLEYSNGKNNNFNERNSRKSKYFPVLGGDALNNNNKNSTIEAPRKSLFPQRKTLSLHASKETNNIAQSVSSNASSDYDIYSGGNNRDSIKKTPGLAPPLNFGNNVIRLSKNININNNDRKSNVEEREIIVHRYNIRISKIEYEALKYNDQMSENIINFFLNFLQEKQNFLSQKKLAFKQLRILYFPLLSAQQLKINSRNDLSKQEKMLRSFEKFDKLLIPINKNNSDWNYVFIMIEMSNKILRIFELFEEEIDSKSEIMFNLKKYLSIVLEQNVKDWKIEMGFINKITDKKIGALFLCKSIYLVSQGSIENDNREKKTYEFKQKLLNVLLKMSKILDQGEIQDFVGFDL